MDARRLITLTSVTLIAAVVPATAGAQVQQVAPDVKDLKITPARFKALGAGGPVVTKGGGLVTFTLNGGANVTFSLKSEKPGHKSGGKCVAGKPKTKKAACTITAALPGSFRFPGISGDNELRLSGRWDKGKLAPGRYRLVAKAEGLAARSSIARFTIIP